VIECEQPTRTTRRGKGKTDPIDAHLAVLTALQVNADKLPTPRADGDREGRCCISRRADTVNSGPVCCSDGANEFGEDCGESVVRVEVEGQLVVSAAQVLDECVASTDHSC
jgi:hypothetical protein